jgi:hypothetical protein
MALRAGAGTSRGNVVQFQHLDEFGHHLRAMLWVAVDLRSEQFRSLDRLLIGRFSHEAIPNHRPHGQRRLGRRSTCVSGTSRSAALLEVIVVVRGGDRQQLAIHAMPMREKYRRLLPGG